MPPAWSVRRPVPSGLENRGPWTLKYRPGLPRIRQQQVSVRWQILASAKVDLTTPGQRCTDANDERGRQSSSGRRGHELQALPGAR
jgi:hypothetical protein